MLDRDDRDVWCDTELCADVEDFLRLPDRTDQGDAELFSPYDPEKVSCLATRGAGANGSHTANDLMAG